MTRQQSRHLKSTFLKHFATFGIVSWAAEEAGIDRSLHYKWLDKDKRYRQAFNEADQKLTESLIKEAVRRGRDGVDEPVIYKGEVMGTYVDMSGKPVPKDSESVEAFVPTMIRRFSDNLLMFTIKARRPEYRDSHREALPPPPDAPMTADQYFQEIHARATAGKAQPAIEEAVIVDAIESGK